jgi:hypothetical protein
VAALYADENFPQRVVDALRRLGHDVRTAFEAGQANQAVPDESVLAFATAEKRALLTLNRWQFIRLHQSAPAHAGIIVCTQDEAVDRQAAAIDESIRGVQSLQGRLVRVNRA